MTDLLNSLLMLYDDYICTPICEGDFGSEYLSMKVRQFSEMGKEFYPFHPYTNKLAELDYQISQVEHTDQDRILQINYDIAKLINNLIINQH